MNAIEVLTFHEAIEQVSEGQAGKALPKLFQLAAAYPQNKDVQAAIRQALNVSAPSAKATPAKTKLTPVTQPIPSKTTPAKTIPARAAPVKATAAQPAEKAPSTGKGWYGLPFVGTLLTAAGAVLPWLNVSQGSSEADFNSLGGNLFGGTSQDSLFDQVTTLALNNLHGWWLFGVLGVLLVAMLFGLFSAGRAAPLVMLLASAAGLALLGWNYTEIKASIEALYSSSNPLAATPGLGFWGSVAGIVINLVGAIVVLFRLNPQAILEKRLKKALG